MRARSSARILSTVLALTSGVWLALVSTGPAEATYDRTPVVLGSVGVQVSPISAVVSPDGRRVYVVNNTSGSLSVIDVPSNTVSTPVTGLSSPIGVAVTPNGSRLYIANSGANSVSVIETGGYTAVATITTGIGSTPKGVAMSPDGSRVYVTNNGSNSVSVIATASNTVTTTITGGIGSSPTGIAASPDGSRVYVVNAASNSMNIISTATDTASGSIPIASAPEGAVVSPDGSSVYVAMYGSEQLAIVNTATNAVSYVSLGVGTVPYSVSVSPDGSRVFVTDASVSGQLLIVNTVTRTVASTVSGLSIPLGVAVNPDGTRAYVTNQATGRVSVIDTGWTPPAPSTSGPVPPTIFTLALDSNQGSCWSSEVSGVANTWVTLPTTGECTRTAYEFAGWSTGRDGSGLTFTPGGQTFLTGDNTLYANWRASSPPAASTASPAPMPPRTVISTAISRGNADASIVTITGSVTPATSATTVRVWYRTRGNPVYQPSAEIPVRADGTFTWTHRSDRRLYAYVTSGESRGQRVTVSRA